VARREPLVSGILVIYAGGTIGMKPGPAGLVSDPQFVARLQAALPDVAFAVFTCEPAIDSSSATPAAWHHRLTVPRRYPRTRPTAEADSPATTRATASRRTS